MKFLCIIPARGGSKGVPGKNIKPLAGKPLIHYTIGSALESRMLTKIVVSSDSDEILDCAAMLSGISVLKRPAELALDSTPTLPVLQHVVGLLSKQGEDFDAVCLLQATSPLRPSGFIDAAIASFTEKNADSLISVLRVPHEYNPHWTFEEQSDGLLRIATGEEQIISRRQELPVAYHRDGALYITSTKVLMEANSLYGQKIAFIESNPNYYVNIDTPDDWNEAEKRVQQIR